MSPPRRQSRKQPSGGHLLLGDCLEWLDAIGRLASPRFDLVYVDPPFNAGVARGLRHGKGERATGALAYRDNWGGLDNFLEMLRPRLAAAYEVMTSRASLWVHLDYRAVHDTKILLDAIFGRNRFEGEIIWTPGNGARRRNGPSVTHQTILVYSRAGNMVWNADDPALREPFAETSRKMHFTQIDGSGRRFRERQIGGKAYRYYEDEGRRRGSVWLDCGAMRANTPLIKEATGYPTQKPERLLERIILAASTPTSWILDPMCGSGTTLAVGARLGRPVVGIDRSERAVSVARARLQTQGTRLDSRLIGDSGSATH